MGISILSPISGHMEYKSPASHRSTLSPLLPKVTKVIEPPKDATTPHKL